MGTGKAIVTNELQGWLTRPEVAARLQCSEKTVDRMAAAGKLQRRYQPKPHQKPAPMFHPADVEREEMARMRPHILQSTTAQGDNALAVAAQETNQALAVFERMIRPPTGVPKLWVTIPEASELSGLSQALLHRLITAGKLQSIRDGSRKVRRADLEQLNPLE